MSPEVEFGRKGPRKAETKQTLDPSFQSYFPYNGCQRDLLIVQTKTDLSGNLAVISLSPNFLKSQINHLVLTWLHK
jgi:hypothetical protein